MTALKLTKAQREALANVLDFGEHHNPKTVDDLEWAGLVGRTDPRLGKTRIFVTDAGRAALKEVSR